MPHGILTDKMLAVIKPYISGRVVHDLGAGDCVHTAMLLQNGATGVEAVDKQYLRSGVQLPPGGRYHQSTFDEYQPKEIDVAFVAWPENDRWTTAGLLPLLQRANTIIYLGKNTRGVMCGRPELFQHFSGRELLAYEPHHLNVLCVYGAPLGRQRTGDELRQEEVAGLSACSPGDPWIDYSDT